MDYGSVSKALNELQWAHSTLIRIIVLVQENAFIDDEQRDCVVHLTNTCQKLERLIQGHLAEARRRRDDSR